MKKTPKYTLILILLIAIFSVDHVSAANDATTIDGTKFVVCSYGNKTDLHQGIEVIYNFGRLDNTAYEAWQIYYRKNGNWILKTSGTYKTAFSGNTAIHREVDGTRFQESFESNFICPPNGFLDFDFIDEVCLGESNTCGSKFDGGPYGQTNDGVTIFEIINKFAEETVFQYMTAEQLKSKDVLTFIKDRTRTYILNKYAFGVTFITPAFLNNYLNNLEQHIDPYDNAIYLETKAKLDAEQEQRVAEAEKRAAEAEQQLAANIITKDEADQIKAEVEQIKAEAEQITGKLKDTFYEALGSPHISGVDPSDEYDCDGLLGPQMTEIVNGVFSFIQYLAPVLVAALSLVDFVKAALSGDDGDMKKATQKLVKRAICGILLFFIPLICKTLFGIAGITIPEYCIGK